MPTVPQYDDQRIQARGLPNVRLSATPGADAFGGGASFDRAMNAAEGFVGEIAKRAEEEQLKADKIRYDQSRIAFNDWERENIYDPEKGAVNSVGEEAFDLDKRLRDSYDKFSAEQRGKLSNDRQRLAFDGLAAERWDHVDRWAKSHMTGQIRVLEKSTRAAKIESSKERAILDPSTIPMELQQIGEAVQEDMRGQTPEVISAELQKHETDLHYRLIGSYLSKGQDGVAQKYFDANMNRIDPDKRESIQEKIRIEGEKIKKKNLESMELAALNVIEQTKDFDMLPKATIEALPRESRSALRNYAKSLRNGDDVETDLPTYYELVGMSDAELKKVNLIAYKDKLSPTDWKKWADIQGGLRSRGGTSPELDGFRSDLAVVDEAMRSAGIRPESLKKTKQGNEKYGLFHAAVEKRQMDLQRRTSKKATNEDLKRIADELLRSGRVEGTGWHIPILGITLGGEEKRAFQLEPGQKFEGETERPVVNSEEQYLALKPGQEYVGPDGNVYRKR